MNRTSAIVLSLLVSLFSLVIVAYYKTVEQPNIENISVEGTNNFSEIDLEKVISEIRLEYGSLHQAGAKAISEALKLAPWVKNAIVSNSAFGHVKIDIEEYEPAIILIKNDIAKIVSLDSQVIVEDLDEYLTANKHLNSYDLPTVILSDGSADFTVDDALWLYKFYQSDLQKTLGSLKHIDRQKYQKWALVASNGLTVILNSYDLKNQATKLSQAMSQGLITDKKIKNILSVDMRVKNRIIIKTLNGKGVNNA